MVATDMLGSFLISQETRAAGWPWFSEVVPTIWPTGLASGQMMP